jgi:hypothetical protein
MMRYPFICFKYILNASGSAVKRKRVEKGE